MDNLCAKCWNESPDDDPKCICDEVDYYDFLKTKAKHVKTEGLKSYGTINPMLKPHQRDIVKWSVEGGRRAIFANFGLGKTFMQLEIMRLIEESVVCRCLIIAPLGVRQEFIRDAVKLGIEIKFIRHSDEVGETGIYITNYESVRDGKLSPDLFDAVTLDEASCLRSYGSKTYQEFLTLFDSVKYRFVATATPSPNRYKELIHYAGFLGVMDTGQALTRFFQRDSTKANNLTLYPHKEAEFWLWISSWAIFLQRPSDLGYSDEGYDLPDLKIHYHEIAVDHTSAGHDRDGQGYLFRSAASGLKEAAKEKRDTIPARVAKLAEILELNPDDHFILWHDLEAERQAIVKEVDGAMDVYGSQNFDVREQRIIDFSDGKIKYLATKPEIAGSGCNFQRFCHKAIFLGIGYKFNDFIQSIHRIQRFQQQHVCEIHLIFAESEREILRTLETKWKNHKIMVKKMSDIIKKYGLNASQMAEEMRRSIGVERIEVESDRYLVANNDCVDECRSMADNSVDQIITSIPFSNHYEYTPSYNDFGHTESNDQFWTQMDHLTPELLRTLKPGRIACIHVKDRILFGNVTGTGVPTVSPFHAEAINHYIKHGFDYMGMITVVTDVVRENNQTYRLGWSEQCKDGTKMGVGSPEYVLLLHKPQTDRTRGYADEPVNKSKDDYSRSRWQIDAHAFWRSSGDRLLTPEELIKMSPGDIARLYSKQSLQQIYNHETHVKIGEALDLKGALPSTFMTLAPGSHHTDVWHDVNRMRTLNGEQSRKNLMMHVCPLQFDIVDRLIRRYSNEDEIIFDPFGGLFTVPYCAIKLNRKGRAVELNPGYFTDGIKYLETAEIEARTPSLFDELEIA